MDILHFFFLISLVMSSTNLAVKVSFGDFNIESFAFISIKFPYFLDLRFFLFEL